MKLLAIRLCEHDSSLCYYDGKNLKYIKTERLNGIKHYAYNDLFSWRKDFEEFFNEDISNINEVAIVVDPWIYNIKEDFEFTENVREFNNLELNCKVWRINHHYAHSLSTWMMTDKEPDACIVMDGFGDLDQSWTIFRKDKVIERGSLEINGSLGVEMAELGRFIGINAQHKIDIPGKLMGLQSYGNISNKFLSYLDKYSIKDVKKLFDFCNWINFLEDEHIARLSVLDWARTLHEKTGSLLVDFFKKYVNREEVISFTGGVAQNVLWNSQLKRYFKNILIPPHCNDDGLTLGAIEWLRIKNNLPRFQLSNFPYIQNDETPLDLPTIETINKTVKVLCNGDAVGWYQGNGEIGPRALGNRSILLDPRIKNGKNIINNIKKRENYRPFGATVLDEYKHLFFEEELLGDPYMLHVSKVKTDSIKSITHIDNTCRVQILKDENPVLRLLLLEFYKVTGCPIILNTSMNLAGRPLVGTIKDAKILFKQSNLKYLVIGNEILQK
jgi:carbamoyltransferase